MIFKCKFCLRTFSQRSALKQHINFCVQSCQSDSEKSTDINDMSLGSEGFSNVDEVKINKIMF